MLHVLDKNHQKVISIYLSSAKTYFEIGLFDKNELNE